MKLISVQDLSCYGQCSLTVALPVLSYFGVETAILPSAVLSTHTGGFTGFTVHDLTDEMPKIIRHWQAEGIKADAVYTGYIGDPRQFDLILDLKKNVLGKDGRFFVDPAMADHGKMYWGLGDEIVAGMRKLSAEADFILPNITEACFLTGTPYCDEPNDDFIDGLLEKLLALGAQNVILTGVERDGKIGAAFCNRNGKETLLFPKMPKSYHGTGDIFSSVVIGELCNGKSVHDAVDAACRFVIASIEKTMPDDSHAYGVKFEEVLKDKTF